jgi:PilZ domain
MNSSQDDSENARLTPEDSSIDYKPRATRFPIRTAFRYRFRGESNWHEGTTINISRTGVLFRSKCEMTPRTILEMCITFPPEMTGQLQTRIICLGPVVRREAPIKPEVHSNVAAAILNYRFSHD